MVGCSEWKGEWYPSFHHKDGKLSQWDRPPELNEKWCQYWFEEQLEKVRRKAAIASASNLGGSRGADDAAGTTGNDNDPKDFVQLLGDGRQLNKTKNEGRIGN